MSEVRLLRGSPPLTCPRCGMVDDVQKVSGLPSWQLSVPAEPQRVSAWSSGAKLGLACLLVLVLCVSGPLIIGLGGLGVLVALAPIAVLVVLLVRTQATDDRMRVAWQAEHAHWRAVMDKWDELYYCWRDDVVFFPGSPSAVPAAAMWSVL